MNLIIQTCAPSYRLNIFTYITSKNNTVKIIAGDEFYSSTIKSDKSTPNVLWIKNIFLFNKRFLFQKMPWKEVYNANSVVIEFNLRNISFYIVLLIRLFFNKKTFLWGHAWSRKGKDSTSEFLRYFFKKITSGYITYTEKQKKELEKQLPKKLIYAANNSIYFKHDMYPFMKEDDEILDFIYVGRLVKEKKVMILIKAFQKVMNLLPVESKLIIVGDGDEFNKIENYLKKHQLVDRIILLGQISDFNRLKELYSKAITSISPGYVGLSITQSLGFGVPMIISQKEPHSPEIEAAKIGFNSEYFLTDDINDLGKTLLAFFKEKDKWAIKRGQISKDCRCSYSVEKMAEPFLKVFKK